MASPPTTFLLQVAKPPSQPTACPYPIDPAGGGDPILFQHLFLKSSWCWYTHLCIGTPLNERGPLRPGARTPVLSTNVSKRYLRASATRESGQVKRQHPRQRRPPTKGCTFDFSLFKKKYLINHSMPSENFLTWFLANCRPSGCCATFGSLGSRKVMA